VSSDVKGAKRRRNGGGSDPGEGAETAIHRDGQKMEALAPGDSLRYALELSLDELRSLRRALGPVLERRPHVRHVLEAIIGRKEQGIDGQRASGGREGRQGND